jgi:hypothetical protein
MKKRVNLLTSNDISSNLTDIINQVSKGSYIALVVLCIVLLGTGAANYYYSKQVSLLQESLANVQAFISGNGNFDKKIKFFIYKNNLLKTFLKDDAKSYTYFLWMKQYLAKNAPEARIDDFSIDNTGTTNVTLNFTQYERAMKFVQFIETPDFLDNFEYVIMQDLVISKESVEANGVSIKIECKFKPIHES